MEEKFIDIFQIAKKSDLEKTLDDIESGKIKLNEKIDKDGKTIKRKKGDFTRYGNLGEMVSEAKWQKIKEWENGIEVNFKPLHTPVQTLDDKIVKGIDAIYENTLFKSPPMPPPPKYIINEVKYHQSNANAISVGIWKNKLSKTITKSGASQMMEEWIEYNLKKILTKETIDDIKIYGYNTFLTGVSKNGRRVETFKLSSNTKTIKKIKL